WPVSLPCADPVPAGRPAASEPRSSPRRSSYLQAFLAVVPRRVVGAGRVGRTARRFRRAPRHLNDQPRSVVVPQFARPNRLVERRVQAVADVQFEQPLNEADDADRQFARRADRQHGPVNLPVEYQVGVADHVVVAVVLRDPEPRPASLEAGLRQVAGERFAVGIQRQFKRRHFIADAFAQGFDAGDLAEYRVLRPVGLPVPGDEPAVAQQHIAARELDLAQSDEADLVHWPPRPLITPRTSTTFHLGAASSHLQLIGHITGASSRQAFLSPVTVLSQYDQPLLPPISALFHANVARNHAISVITPPPQARTRAGS